jgi:polycystin 1L2
VSSPLGRLNYLRIWHDNSGVGNNASWFLKFVIVHDLQTREKYYFICNKWLSVEYEDSQIDRILPAAGSAQKKEIAYLVEKETMDNLKDGHLWFSLISRPILNPFSRVDRLTCIFVLMCITGLVNIIYYDMDKSPASGLLKVGPFQLSTTQVKTSKLFKSAQITINYKKSNVD